MPGVAVATRGVAARLPAAWVAGLRELWGRSAAWGLARLWLLGLLGLALVASGLAVPWLAAARAEREAQSQTLRQRLVTLSAAPAHTDRVQDAAGYVARFPAAAEQGQRLAALLAAAERQGLIVQRAELREAPVPGLPGLVQQRVNLPVSGSPQAVWAWAGEAMEHDPALALLRLRMERERRREAAGAPGAERPRSSAVPVRADLEFALYARSGTGPAVPVAAR